MKEVKKVKVEKDYRPEETRIKVAYLVKIGKNEIIAEKSHYPLFEEGFGNRFSHCIQLYRKRKNGVVYAKTWCEQDGWSIHGGYGSRGHFSGKLHRCYPSIFEEVEKEIDIGGDEVAEKIFYWLSREVEYDSYNERDRGRICWEA